MKWEADAVHQIVKVATWSDVVVVSTMGSVGGGWRAKTRAIPEPLRSRARLSWMHRWGSLLACAAARAFGSSLLDRRGQPGTDGEALPVADVLSDFCSARSAGVGCSVIW